MHKHIKIYKENNVPYNTNESKYDLLTPYLEVPPFEAIDMLFNPAKRRNDNLAINTVQRYIQIPQGHISDKMDDEPYIVPFIKGSKESVLIVPGGAYYDVSMDNEGYPSAEYLNKLGISAFVLKYRVYPYLFPACQLDLKRAIRYIKYHAIEFGIDPDKLVVLGYSAGGNLVATSNYVVKDYPPELKYEKDEIDQMSCDVKALALIYPELLADKNLMSYQFGDKVHHDEKFYECIKELEFIPRYIDKNSPALFLMDCIDDNVVSPMNIIEMARSAHQNNVKFEVHMFVEGGHGFGMRQDDIPAMWGNPPFNLQGTNMWPELLVKWMKKVL